MPTLKLFVTTPDANGKIACASLNILKDLTLPDGQPITNDDEVAAYFGNKGETHIVTLAPELTGTMEERIEALTYDKDGKRLAARRDGATAAATVKDWTFSQPVSFEGFQALPRAIRQTLGVELTLFYYAGVNDYAAFTPASTGK